MNEEIELEVDSNTSFDLPNDAIICNVDDYDD